MIMERFGEGANPSRQAMAFLHGGYQAMKDLISKHGFLGSIHTAQSTPAIDDPLPDPIRVCFPNGMYEAMEKTFGAGSSLTGYQFANPKNTTEIPLPGQRAHPQGCTGARSVGEDGFLVVDRSGGNELTDHPSRRFW